MLSESASQSLRSTCYVTVVANIFEYIIHNEFVNNIAGGEHRYDVLIHIGKLTFGSKDYHNYRVVITLMH